MTDRRAFLRRATAGGATATLLDARALFAEHVADLPDAGRTSPNVQTTAEEIERFLTLVERTARA